MKPKPKRGFLCPYCGTLKHRPGRCEHCHSMPVKRGKRPKFLIPPEKIASMN